MLKNAQAYRVFDHYSALFVYTALAPPGAELPTPTKQTRKTLSTQPGQPCNFLIKSYQPLFVQKKSPTTHFSPVIRLNVFLLTNRLPGFLPADSILNIINYVQRFIICRLIYIVKVHLPYSGKLQLYIFRLRHRLVFYLFAMPVSLFQFLHFIKLRLGIRVAGG